MYDDLLGDLQEVRAKALDMRDKEHSRAFSVMLTKLDEAILWRQEDLRLKAPAVNEDDDESADLAADADMSFGESGALGGSES